MPSPKAAESAHFAAKNREHFAADYRLDGWIQGCPALVTADPAEALAGARVVLIARPAFQYEWVCRILAPHLEPGTFVGASPGLGGFDWIARRALADCADVTVFGVVPMPFNCRIDEFGRTVLVQMFEPEYWACAESEVALPDVLTIWRALVGPTSSGGHFLTATLWPLNGAIHPPHLCVLLEGWEPGQVLAHNPLFYEEMDGRSGALMTAVSDSSWPSPRRPGTVVVST